MTALSGAGFRSTRWFSQLTTGCQAEVASAQAKHIVVPVAGGYACERRALPIRHYQAADARFSVLQPDPPDAMLVAAYRLDRNRLQLVVDLVRSPATGQDAHAPLGPEPAVPPPPRVAGFLPACSGRQTSVVSAPGHGRSMKAGVNRLHRCRNRGA